MASCTSAGDPSLQLASPAYNDAGAPEFSAGDASALTSEANVELPEQVAYLPAGNPAAANSAVAEEANASPAAELVASAEETQPAKTTAPGQIAGNGTFLQNGGPILTAGVMPDAPIEPKKKSFLSSLFGASPAAAAPAPVSNKAVKPLVKLAAAEPEQKPVEMASLGEESSSSGEFALPGVRQTALFEIKRKSGLDDYSDVDLHEGEDSSPILLASAAGLARLAPNGLLKQRETVDVACLKPELVRILKTVERHFGRKIVVTSGYRSPSYNRKVRGAKKSQHMYCAAADVQLAGVSKWELAKYVRTMPGRGGVGTYCNTESVHIDVGPERDWNWRCRRRSS